ncbi:hypothetical protein [Streptomyces adustus]|uniref:hypothetical protein n=1 Tax=Streptomyces adustus TaxID=1609272 RepID=UPI00308446A8
MAVAAATGVMHPEASGIPDKPAREDAVASRGPCCGIPARTAAGLAALLRDRPWAT